MEFAEEDMRRIQSEGYSSATSRSEIPAEYAAHRSMKAAWEYGRALAENDGPNYWDRYQKVAAQPLTN